MPDATKLLGLLAAALTSLSYIPQVRKALPRKSTDDLSLKMLLALLPDFRSGSPTGRSLAIRSWLRQTPWAHCLSVSFWAAKFAT